MKVLFICRGNVGRSQMAEALLNKLGQGDYIVFSAGTKLSGPEQKIGDLRPATDNVIEAMAEMDIDISNNVRRQLTEEMAKDADKIILVVDENDPIPEYLRNNNKVIEWTIPDPKGQSVEFAIKVRDQILSHIKKEILNIGQ